MNTLDLSRAFLCHDLFYDLVSRMMICRRYQAMAYASTMWILKAAPTFPGHGSFSANSQRRYAYP